MTKSINLLISLKHFAKGERNVRHKIFLMLALFLFFCTGCGLIKTTMPSFIPYGGLEPDENPLAHQKNLDKLDKSYQSATEICKVTIYNGLVAGNRSAWLQSTFSTTAIIAGTAGAIVLAASPANTVAAAILSGTAGLFAGLDKFYGKEGEISKERELAINGSTDMRKAFENIKKDWPSPAQGITSITPTEERYRRERVINDLISNCSIPINDIPAKGAY